MRFFKTKKNFFKAAPILSAALSVAFWNTALVSTPAEARQASSVKASGFDYADVAEGVTLSDYGSVEIVKVDADLDQDRDRELDENEIEDQADELSERLSDAVDGLSGGGDATLEIKVTLTELVPSRPVMSDYSRKPGLSFQSVYLGGAAADFEFVDSETGEVVASLSDRDFGNSLNDGRLRASPWSDAHDAFRRWERNIAKFIEEN